MVRSRRPVGCASNRRCLEILKFLIQNSLLNCPADTGVAGLGPPQIDQLKQCVATGEAKIEGLVQCTPLCHFPKQIGCQSVASR